MKQKRLTTKGGSQLKVANSQKFKGQTLTRTKVVNNILKTFNKRAYSEGANWYDEANEFARRLSFKYDIQTSKVCGVIAALSPLKTWEQNQLITNEKNYGINKFKSCPIMNCRTFRRTFINISWCWKR